MRFEPHEDVWLPLSSRRARRGGARGRQRRLTDRVLARLPFGAMSAAKYVARNGRAHAATPRMLVRWLEKRRLEETEVAPREIGRDAAHHGMDHGEREIPRALELGRVLVRSQDAVLAVGA